MASRNRVSGRVVYYLYATLKGTGGEENEISRDPLHRRYEVNRYGLSVSHRDDDTARLKELRQALIRKLMDDGWTVNSNQGSVELETVRDGRKVHITIDPVLDSAMGISRPPRYDIHPYVW